ncbi:MAG: response regulator [Planctomycetota bacterium]
MQAPARHASRPGLVYIVDDDEAHRRTVARIVERAGWPSRQCDSGAELQRQLDGTHPACIVLDHSMPIANGIEVQRDLLSRGVDLPVIFLTGGGSIPFAVEALRGGALDYMQKPVDPALLVERIEAAMVADSRRVELASMRQRFETLTEREVEICSLLARGLASKQIAKELSISSRTVEHHRERILKKTGTANIAELASLYTLARGSPLEPGA